MTFVKRKPEINHVRTVTDTFMLVIEDRPGFVQSGPEVIKYFSCSSQLSMKFSLLINMKMPTIVGIFIFISREIFMLSYV